MVFDNSIINLIEDIETFTYRNQASIRIPKEWRERAWIMEVDIKISSIKREEYLSFSSNPANGQYGYAVLVMRDHCEVEIPISLPRQRLYYGIVYDAFVNYYSLYYSYVTSRQLSFISSNQLVPIAQELGLSVSIPPNQCPEQPLWIELPLREIYIKCFDGTQFDVEFSRRRLVEPLVLGECAYDGKSNMIDGSKDAGLPANGIAPNKATDPNNPFDGLKPTTSIENLGEWFNNKGEVLNNVDPDNLPEFLDANGNPLNFSGGQCTGNPNQGYWVFIKRFFNPALQQEFVNPDIIPPSTTGIQLPVTVQVIAVDTIFIGNQTVWRFFLSNNQIVTTGAFGGSNGGFQLVTDYDIEVVLYDYSISAVVPDTCGNYRPFE